MTQFDNNTTFSEHEIIEERLDNLFNNFEKDTVVLVVGDGFIQVDDEPLDIYIKKKFLERASNNIGNDEFKTLKEKCDEINSLAELIDKCYPYLACPNIDLFIQGIIKEIKDDSYDASKLIKLLNLGHINVILSTSVTNKFRHIVEDFAKNPDHNQDFYYVELQGDQFSITPNRPWSDINRDQIWFVNLMGHNSFGDGNLLKKLRTSEEDMIKFVRSWVTATQKAPTFTSYLQNCFLLMLGCNVPNWAFRFIWYLIKNPSMQTNPNHAVCSTNANYEIENKFANQFQTSILNLRKTDEFIEKITTRWRPGNPSFHPRIYKDRPGKYRDVFISYASEDRDLVLKRIIPIMEELRSSHKLSFWYDKETIRASKPWNKEIEEGVLTARIFLTLQTKNSKIIADDVSSDRYLKTEWRVAKNCQESMNVKLGGQNTQFTYILPVIYDDEQNYADEFKEMQIQHIMLEESDRLKKSIILLTEENKKFDEYREI